MNNYEINKQNKDIIFNLIQKEKKRQIKSISLIASENFVSPQILKSMSSVLTNKYAEGYPKKRYYSGCHIIDKIEQISINRAKKLFNVSYVNVQPHSGSQANAAVYMSCLHIGDTILSLNLSHGGHLTHGASVSFSGIIYKSIFYGLNKKSGIIDYDMAMKLAIKNNPKLIICGASTYSRDIKYEYFREIADNVGAILMADISHTSGLIATGLLNNPFSSCHIVTSTTHKTLRGPRGGIIMMKEDFENILGIKFSNGIIKKMSQVIDSSVFPGNQGGPLEHIIAAKAVCFEEAMTKEYKKYTKQILLNAKTLANFLISKGYKIISDGTDNHCMLIDLTKKNITGKEAEEKLEFADINCNKNMIPFDINTPYITSGIRLGTSAVTTRGLKEENMEKIGYWIHEILKNKNNISKIKLIKKDVNKLMSSYPLFTW